ncbi:MAG: hypothetical protein Q7K39_01065 [Candidatus Magasanikbacteria bacterium]|nr:hypothetical protein [Candidatus Magasanikbacteria bacterium]
MYFLVFQQILGEAILDLVYFPVWWYSFGFGHAAKNCWVWFLQGNARLAPGLWLKNIFVPMFGQYDWEGRIISFVMRFFQVIMRSLALLVWLIFCVVLLLFWIGFPLLILSGIVQLFIKAR